MANSNDPIETLRKSLNAYTIAQEAIVKAANEVPRPEAPTPAAPEPSQKPEG